jgi:hypothetical protein
MGDAITGTVTFGEGPQPTAGSGPDAVYPTFTESDGTFPTSAVNWNYSPFPGFPTRSSRPS